MLASSTGKLVRYLVPDGGHLAADAPYAEARHLAWRRGGAVCLRLSSPPALLFMLTRALPRI